MALACFLIGFVAIALVIACLLGSQWEMHHVEIDE